MVKNDIAFSYKLITIKIYGNVSIFFYTPKILPFSCGHGSKILFIVVYWWKKIELNLVKNLFLTMPVQKNFLTIFLPKMTIGVFLVIILEISNFFLGVYGNLVVTTRT